MTTKEMEFAIFNYFCNSYPLITTNITKNSGVVNHECDILMASKNNYLTEIEIKISAEDFKKDFSKKHKHEDKRIKYQYFALPYGFSEDLIKLIPEHFGIIYIEKKKIKDSFCRKVPVIRTSYVVFKGRDAKINKDFDGYKLSDKQLMNFYRLAAMRYWSSKKRELKSEGLYTEEKIINEMGNE